MLKYRGVLLIMGLVFAAATAGILIWASTPLAPMPEALAALQSDSQVQVTEGSWITFQPAGAQTDTGLILYPGGRVDPRAYAPLASLVAQQGYLVVIVPMPFNLAVLDPSRAQDIIDAYPEIKRWVIGGHSLGGAMAANFANNHGNEIDGLVLWAAYPASSDDLSMTELHVVSIYGTLDGLATGIKINASRPLLPADTIWAPITGGNHAQFGWYGEQAGDNAALIDRADQQTRVVAATLALLEDLE
jgi:pimeloyl-ACP methyl ester carboxylesterase